MALLFFLVLLVCAIVRPKSKYVTIAIILFMWFMYSFVYYEGDLQTYELIYNAYGNGTMNGAFEPVFSLLMWIFSSLEIPFMGFRMFLATVYVGLQYSIVKRITNYTAITLAVLIVFPFFVFVSVLRSGIASGIILCAIPYLTKKDKVSNVKFCICVMLATLIHYSSIIFLIFIFAKRKIDTKKLGVLFALALILGIILSYTDIAYQIVSAFISNQKVLQWFSKSEATANLTGTIAEAIVLFSNAFCAKNAMKICCSNAGKKYLGSFKSRMSEITYNVSLIMVFLLPLMIIASPFIRLPYMMFALNVSSFVNAIQVVKHKNRAIFGGENDRVSYIGIGTLAMTALWAFYFDLPYLKAGTTFFMGLFHTKIG